MKMFNFYHLKRSLKRSSNVSHEPIFLLLFGSVVMEIGHA
jgi:hypothetical protein